ncbi:FAD/NAD(P)-dependent oxidoreductase [Granulicella tundricola]|uniref:FAD-dependent pyridine nucleotide-disulfide oxidoreductase n=1 Tax=Granulicella tundricola (strain ATCC BAA-1859 / DSM 23138 / MP5ACTX9) TaxID=1198114 RepID=E8X6E1_GRATM|nr:FAD/NAD(P)-binding oxidoreductase [Granulicella tundricola]ADW71025.1 FAD-dependent pyridine nucleotide-disulfide oxidoreductase [Granulicella tundricola MP5ACTX9]
MIWTDVLVIGAGPAGIAAATAAGENGREVIVLDDNAAPGGQIWRGGVEAPVAKPGGGEDAAKDKAIARLKRSGAELLSGYRVFDAQSSSTVQAIHQNQTDRFSYKHLVLATGARERFLPFPGWTLPGVFGAGGLQALVKGGFPVKGKRVVVAGTGPLLLAVAAHLKAYGAKVVCVAEQASVSQLAPFAASLWSHPAKVWQGVHYRATLASTPYRNGCWPVAATSNQDASALSSVTLSDGKRTWDEPCDLLACGFHLVPNTELASLLGCELEGAFVKVDEQQRTSLPEVFCAGEPTGIAGLEAALIQGEIAGLTCAGKPTSQLKKRAAAERGFGQRLEKAFALRPEVLKLATPQTIVCRCEDVPLGKISGHIGWTDAKLQTRCGMGPCQGRICGPAVEALLGWRPVSIRQPLYPVPLEVFCSEQEEPEPVSAS